MSLYTPKAVYAASERQYTRAGGEVQVPRGGFTSDGRRSGRRLIHGLVKLTQFCVSFIALLTKREPSNTAKLSVFTSVFVPILTYGYGHESWVMAQRILTQVQAPKMGFLRRVHGVTKGRIPRLDCARGKKQVWRLHI